MAAYRRVAVVTGSNKGIGFSIVRALCRQFDGDVIATARDITRGKDAIAALEEEGLHPKFYQLDLLDLNSISRLKEHLQENYSGLDVLVNNAGIAYKTSSTVSFAEQAEVTVRTNFQGTLDVCVALFPILRPHARVVNVSSMLSTMSIKKCSPDIQAQLKAQGLTLTKLQALMQKFVNSTKAGTFVEDGWPQTAYGVSKIGITVMSFIQQREMDNDGRDDIVINACCPGYVSTDMTSHKGTKTTDEGADTPTYLALLPPNVPSPRGQHVSERKIVEWRS